MPDLSGAKGEQRDTERSPSNVAATDPRKGRRGADAVWESHRSSRKPSDDPGVETLWSMSLAEVENVQDDPDHPLHEKVDHVMQEAVAPIRSDLRKFLAGSDAFTRLVSTANEALREKGTVAAPRPLAKELYEPPKPIPTLPIETRRDREQRKTNQLLHDLNAAMAAMVDVARSDAAAAREEAVRNSAAMRSSSRAAWAGVWIMAATMAIGVIALIFS